MSRSRGRGTGRTAARWLLIALGVAGAGLVGEGLGAWLDDVSEPPLYKVSLPPAPAVTSPVRSSRPPPLGPWLRAEVRDPSAEGGPARSRPAAASPDTQWVLAYKPPSRGAPALAPTGPAGNPAAAFGGRPPRPPPLGLWLNAGAIDPITPAADPQEVSVLYREGDGEGGLAAVSDAAPLIAIVIDDMGLNREMGWQAIGLPVPVTMAYLPYAHDLEEQTAAARRAGHEVILHLPMEPEEGLGDPGPNALLTNLDEAELERRLLWNLGRVDHYAGVSNHMGSRLMRSPEAVGMVMLELKKRGLFFLDSLTVRGSLGWPTARRMGLGTLRRDVFLDNEREADEILKQLAKLEAIAARQGFAIGIGHPHPETLATLARWLPEARERGFTFAPVGTLIALTWETKVARGPQAATLSAP